MRAKLSFRLFIVRLIHDLVLNLLNSLNFCGFIKVSFRCVFVNKMADETRNYGPARDASQPIRARDFTGSSLCMPYNLPNLFVARLATLEIYSG